jgi:hypothetical protein
MCQMDKLELKKRLDDLEINPDYYSLEGELLPDRIVLYQNYNLWEVFYFDERGYRDNNKVFHSEGEACDYIYNYFKKQQAIEKMYQ